MAEQAADTVEVCGATHLWPNVSVVFEVPCVLPKGHPGPHKGQNTTDTSYTETP
jgi:hypothetical protein